MGTRSCGCLRSCVPAFLDFSSAFLYDNFFAFPCAPAFLFRVPMLLCQQAYVWGVGEQLITCALQCVYGRIRRAGSTRHHATTSPLVNCARCTSILAGSRFEVILVSCPQSPPSTSLLSTCHNCLSIHRNAYLAFFFLSHSAFLYKICVPAHPRS